MISLYNGNHDTENEQNFNNIYKNSEICNRRMFIYRSLSYAAALALIGSPKYVLSKNHNGPLRDMVEKIYWFTQSAFKIKLGSRSLYTDPFKIPSKQKADIICLSHIHQDHFSVMDIKKILTKETVVVGPRDCIQSLKVSVKNKMIMLNPGMEKKIGDITITATPAYNIKKTKYHPKKNNWNGYIFSHNGISIYHAGDTERVPELKAYTADIVLLPLGQTYTMNSVEEATQLALDLKAKVAIPMHYGLYEGTEDDALQFKKLLAKKVRVIIKSRAVK